MPSERPYISRHRFLQGNCWLTLLDSPRIYWAPTLCKAWLGLWETASAVWNGVCLLSSTLEWQSVLTHCSGILVGVQRLNLKCNYIGDRNYVKDQVKLKRGCPRCPNPRVDMSFYGQDPGSGQQLGFWVRIPHSIMRNTLSILTPDFTDNNSPFSPFLHSH